METEYYAIPDNNIAQLTIKKSDLIFNVKEFYIPDGKTTQEIVDEHTKMIIENDKESCVKKIIVTYRGESLEKAVILGVTGVPENIEVKTHKVKYKFKSEP